MGIKSNSFGGVVLTGADAKKFRQQITYGKPKAAASKSVKWGEELSRKFHKGGGSVKLTVRNAKTSN